MDIQSQNQSTKNFVHIRDLSLKNFYEQPSHDYSKTSVHWTLVFRTYGFIDQW